MPTYRSNTAVPANGVVENILADLRIRNIPLEYINGATVTFACIAQVAAPTADYKRPSLQAFIGSDQVIEDATPGSVVVGAYGTQVLRPTRLGPQVPTDTMFAGEGALPGDLIRISARGAGTDVTLYWLLDVQEVL